jgi:hypothetical protein
MSVPGPAEDAALAVEYPSYIIPARTRRMTFSHRSALVDVAGKSFLQGDERKPALPELFSKRQS